MTNPDIDTPFLPIRRFAKAANGSASHIRNQLDAGVLDGIKDGKIVKIRQTPREFLESRPKYQPGSRSVPAGPGRGHRKQHQEQIPP
jgi:hypothetical protein